MLVATALVVGSVHPLRAQLVGAEPSKSPFRDLETTQQLTFGVGWMDAASDAGGVGPAAAPFYSLRHDLRLGGPIWLTSRYGFMRSDRRVIDPELPVAERFQGLQSVTHHIADIGLTMALTGNKSWRSMVPTFGFGLGVTSDFGSRDVGGYLFGTKFALTFGPGLRFVLPRGYSIRVDLTNTLNQFQYPSTYFAQGTDSTPVLTNTEQRSGWLSNWRSTVGFSIPLFR